MRGHWAGVVATILAASIGVGFAAAMIGATVQHEQISQQGAALLTTLGGAIIGAVAGWLGGSASERAVHERGHIMSEQQPEQPDVVVDPNVDEPDVDTQPTERPTDEPEPDDDDSAQANRA